MPWRDGFNWQWLPFFLATGQSQSKMNVARIIEAMIIASITAGIVLYGTVQVLGAEIKSMQKDIQRIERSVGDIKRDFYKPAIR